MRPKRCATHVADLLAAQYPVLDWWALASALHRLASTISMMVVLLIGALLVSRGELRIGDIVAFTGFATLLISRLDQVSAFVNQIFEARAKLEDFYALEDASAAASGAGGPARTRARHRPCALRERRASSFPIPARASSDISFEVQAGQTVAIVGPTGAGKTTLINLLQRVHAPQRGRILIDGVDTRSVTRKSLRQSIATVFQDAGLFNRTIEENIRIGRDGAANDEVHAAAEAAAAHDFILAEERRLRHAGRRARQPAFGRRAPAHRHRPRHPEERADPGARRGDQRARRRDRGARQGSDRPAARRTARPSSSRTG